MSTNKRTGGEGDDDVRLPRRLWFVGMIVFVAAGIEDLFTKAEAARKHCEAVGLGAEYIERRIR